MQRNTWGPTEAEIGDPVGGERGEGNVGDTGVGESEVAGNE